MHKSRLYPCIIMMLGFCLVIVSCKVPAITQATENKTVPDSYGAGGDSSNIATLPWRRFFTDKNLANLIDTALVRNQELNITFQEIEMAKNDVLLRQGPLRPYLSARLGVAIEKVGRYTSQGAGDDQFLLLTGFRPRY